MKKPTVIVMYRPRRCRKTRLPMAQVVQITCPVLIVDGGRR